MSTACVESLFHPGLQIYYDIPPDSAQVLPKDDVTGVVAIGSEYVLRAAQHSGGACVRSQIEVQLDARGAVIDPSTVPMAVGFNPDKGPAVIVTHRPLMRADGEWGVAVLPDCADAPNPGGFFAVVSLAGSLRRYVTGERTLWRARVSHAVGHGVGIGNSQEHCPEDTCVMSAVPAQAHTWSDVIIHRLVCSGCQAHYF